MNLSVAKTRTSQGGFSLVELMIGLLIALLATVVVYQVYEVSEAQKRTTLGGNDAQQNGSFSMYLMSKDIGNAGAAIAPSMALFDTCPAALKPMPVVISAGAAATDPDSITIMQGVSRAPSLGIRLSGPVAAGGTQSLLITGAGVAAGDVVYYVNPAIANNCEVLTLSAVTAPDAVSGIRTVTHSALTNAYTVSSQVVPLGPAGQNARLRYRVNNGNLTVEDLSGAAGEQVIANGIVGLKAQYGVDSNNDGVLEWTSALTAGFTEADLRAKTASQLRQIRAVRIAVVARSESRETSEVTPATQILFPNRTAPINAAPAIEVSLTSEQRRYRYKVYEAVIPLRNVIWNTTS